MISDGVIINGTHLLTHPNISELKRWLDNAEFMEAHLKLYAQELERKERHQRDSGEVPEPDPYQPTSIEVRADLDKFLKGLEEQWRRYEALLNKSPLRKAPQIEVQPTGTKPPKKLKWLATQRDLAQLLITLQEKGYVAPIEDGDNASVCRNICNLFDLSETQKGENTDPVHSFTQIMKKDTDPITYQVTYPRAFSKKKKSVFADIPAFK